MKVKTWIPLALAIVLGLFAAKLARNAMSRGPEQVVDGSVVPTVTAARDIEPGQPLTPADLTVGKVSADSVPAGSFRGLDDANLKERVAITRIVRGLPVTESVLAPAGTAAGMQALIPPGMRAITIQVNEFSGVGGLLTPGSRVDVISVVPAEDRSGTVARTVVQNAEIRAVGRQVTAAAAAPQPDPNAPGGVPPMPPANNVTLLVTPDQAEAVQLASTGGAPWLVLRNAKDTEPVESDGTTLADLRGTRNDAPKLPVVPEPTKLTNDPFGDAPLAAKAPAAPKTRTVKFIRGTKESSIEVEVAPPPPSGWSLPPAGGMTATTDPAEIGGGGGGHGFNK